MTRRRDAERGTALLGFTLIEVLGAVAVLAILYTVLASVAIQALRAEGESRRRMEASLLIGEHLAALEAASALGSAPDLGEEIEEIDIFSVQTSVRAVAAESLGFEKTAAAEGGAGLLFAESENADPPPLREIEILIRWSEGDRELEVARSTYALDISGMADLVPAGTGESGADRSDDGSGSRSGEGGRGSGRDSGGGGSSDAVDCSSPCPARDVDCLVRQLSQCV